MVHPLAFPFVWTTSVATDAAAVVTSCAEDGVRFDWPTAETFPVASDEDDGRCVAVCASVFVPAAVAVVERERPHPILAAAFAPRVSRTGDSA